MNFFVQMKESVTDFGFYRKIRDNRFGKSFAYFAILMLIIFAISCVKTFIVSDRGFNDFLDSYLPDFKIEKGEFSTNVPMPHYVVNEPNTVFIIDTTGKTDRRALDSKNTGILVTKDRVYINGSGQHTEYSFKELGATTLTKADFYKFASSLKWIVLALTPLIFIFVLGWKLLNAVVLALLGMMLSSMYKANLKYNQLLNISMYALTLPLLLQLAVNLSGYYIRFAGFFYWLISLSYVAAAVSACRQAGNGGRQPGDDGTYTIASPAAPVENIPEQLPGAGTEENASEDNPDDKGKEE